MVVCNPFGEIANDILSPAQTVAIMQTLDEVRRQIGLKYDGVDG